jgi:predicted HAD superfamily phosphohydrolase
MTNHEEPSVYYSSLEGRFLAHDGVELVRSLEGPALAFEGNIFAFRHSDAVVVRLAAGTAASAIEAGHGSSFRSSETHTPPTWVLVPFSTHDPERFAHYMERAYENARSLVR